MPKTFIPELVIKDYIDQAVKDKQFGREIVFTGGEITSAYKFVGYYYMPSIINHALNSGCSVDIKTNAGWVNSSLAPQIYSDIENIVRGQARKDDTGIKTLINFQVSLSLDRFHRDALARDIKFIEHFAHTDIPGVAMSIHVSSLPKDKDMFPDLMHQLMKKGIEVNNLCMLKPGNQEQMYDLNRNVVIRYSVGTLFDGGRAKDLGYAFKTPFPQFTFVTPTPQETLIAFDSFGNVTLGENSGPKISAKWLNDDYRTRPFNHIYTELLAKIHLAESDFLKQHKVLNNYLNMVKKLTK